MSEPIEQRRGHLGVAEHAGPPAEAEVGGDDDAGLLVELAEQMEQQRPAWRAERQIAQLVEMMRSSRSRRSASWPALLPGGAIRPTQGRTLALMQVSGGSQSFNALNQMRILGRWMRMVTIPNQSSVAKAFQEFDEAGRMKPSSYYDRVVDVMEELVKFTLVNRGVSGYLTSRYSERKEAAAKLEERVGRKSI